MKKRTVQCIAQNVRYIKYHLETDLGDIEPHTTCMHIKDTLKPQLNITRELTHGAGICEQCP